MDTTKQRGAGRRSYWGMEPQELPRNGLQALLQLSRAFLDAEGDADALDAFGAYLVTQLEVTEAVLYLGPKQGRAIRFDRHGAPAHAEQRDPLLALASASLLGELPSQDPTIHSASFSPRYADTALLVRWSPSADNTTQEERERMLSFAADMAVAALRQIQARAAVAARGEGQPLREAAPRDQLEAELQVESLTDPLTGLTNRRGFYITAEHAFRSAQRRHAESAVIFADVDNLKQVNDLLGHEVGDQMIRDAANVFRESFRNADIVARLGGDEFVAFTLDDEHPELILHRIEANLHAFNLMQDRPYQLAFTTGVVACDPNSGPSLADYLVLADQQMYERKQKRLH